MTEADYARMLAELDCLLNDPDVPMQPARVRSLLATIAQRDLTALALRSVRHPLPATDYDAPTLPGSLFPKRPGR